MFKKICLFLFVLTLFITNVNALVLSDFTIDDKFHVYSLEYDNFQEVGVFENYKDASNFFETNKDSYNNLSIYSNGYFYKAEYAIVAFKYSDKCDYNVEFNNDLDNSKNYLNACYGVDGAYVDTSENGTKIKFKISGVDGWANFSDVTIYPLQLLPGRLTKYKVIDNNLFHQIKHSFNNDYYSSIINLGEAPEYLENGLEYFSYDGHYFYNDDSLWLMLDDYRNSNTNNSVNKDNPYYNYYQFVSNRTLSNYSYKLIDEYLKNNLHMNGEVVSYIDYDRDSINDIINKTQFYNQIDSFYQYQYQYGANALMMISLSMNESASGRSSLAFTRNNLFGHSAFDSDVEKNASRYLNPSSSIYSHAKYYISNSYCNPKKFQYHGCFFGNKSSGMNVSYASDPYWGEKAAQNYYLLDKKLGMEDFNKYTIGIKDISNEINIYKNPNSESEILYSTDKQKDTSFIILETINNDEGQWYKIQSDAALNDDGNVDNNVYYYSFKDDIGYIKSDNIKIINQGKSDIIENVKITFDAKEGLFRDNTNKVVYDIEINKIPTVETPTLQGYLFTGWDKNIVEATSEEYYSATYKKVLNIEMVSIPKTQYEINDRIDISNGKIKVNFEDGTSNEVELSTSMVSNFDFKVAGEQEVIVTYGGSTTSYKIDVSEELDVIRNQIRDEIITLIEESGNSSNFDSQRLLDLKNKIDTYMVPSINQSRIRSIDKIFYEFFKNKINYIVDGKSLDGSVSGLALSVKLEKALEKKFFKDNIKITIKKSNINNKLKELAIGNNYTIFNGLKVSGNKNFGELNLHGPIIVKIKKPEGALENQLFSVLHIKGDNILELYTTQSSNYIMFVTDSFGDFLVVAKNTTNTYSNEDILENIQSTSNNSYLLYILISSGLLFILLYLLKRKRFNDKQKN